MWVPWGQATAFFLFFFLVLSTALSTIPRIPCWIHGKYSINIAECMNDFWVPCRDKHKWSQRQLCSRSQCRGWFHGHWGGGNVVKQGGQGVQHQSLPPAVLLVSHPLCLSAPSSVTWRWTARLKDRTVRNHTRRKWSWKGLRLLGEYENYTFMHVHCRPTETKTEVQA